jgi:GntR family transcriptional regulator
MEQNLEHLIAEFVRSDMPGMPKHVRLRNAVLSAIRKGYLRPGDQIPPEQEFSRAIGLSLGTVQRALNGLATVKAVTREQGRGTFIAESNLPYDELWQFRFVERIGDAPLPVRADVIERRMVRQRGQWADLLGNDDKGYCEVTRAITVDAKFRCLSRFYVSIARFPKIMKMPESKIAGNLKRVLAEAFDTPTLSLDQYILPCVFDDDVSAQLGVDRGTSGMVIHAVGHSIGQEVISFQSLWVPAGGYLVEMISGGGPFAGRSS